MLMMVSALVAYIVTIMVCNIE